MSPLAKLALGSAWATLLVAGAASGAKVRIDARAHRLAAESLREHALAADDVRELEAAGEAEARAMASYTPFDAAPHAAAAALLATARLLADRGAGRAAVRVLDLGIASADASALLWSPLADERDALDELRAALAERAEPATAGADASGAPAPPAESSPSPPVPPSGPGAAPVDAVPPAEPAAAPGQDQGPAGDAAGAATPAASTDALATPTP